MSTDKVREARKAHAALRKQLNEQATKAGMVWNDESEKEIATATSIEEAIKAYKRAPRGYPAKEKALKKWVDLCTTLNNFLFAHRCSHRSFFQFWYGTDVEVESDELGYGARKWTELAMRIIASAETFRDLVHTVRYSCPSGCYDSVVRRAIELSTDPEQIRFIEDNFRMYCRKFENELSRRYEELREKGAR